MFSVSPSAEIKNVEQLFQTVLLYCGLDFSLRDTAGILTRLATKISDQAVKERLDGCALWLSEMVKQMLPALPLEVAEKVGRRWLLIDGSTVQGARSKRDELSNSFGMGLVDTKNC